MYWLAFFSYLLSSLQFSVAPLAPPGSPQYENHWLREWPFSKQPVFPAHITQLLASMSKTSLKLLCASQHWRENYRCADEWSYEHHLNATLSMTPTSAWLDRILPYVLTFQVFCCLISMLLNVSVASSKARTHFLTNREHFLCGDGILKAPYYTQI